MSVQGPLNFCVFESCDHVFLSRMGHGYMSALFCGDGSGMTLVYEVLPNVWMFVSSGISNE